MKRRKQFSGTVVCRRSEPKNDDCSGGAYRGEAHAHSRREVLLASSLALGAWFLQSTMASGEDVPPSSPTPEPNVMEEATAPKAEVAEEEAEVINSRIYDATVIGEPMAVGKDKRKVWEKLMDARIVYLGEAEQVPILDDKELELEIVKSLRNRCAEIDRPISLALEAFPSTMQDQLNQYMDKRYY